VNNRNESLGQGRCADDPPELSADLQEELERLKWNLWHGKVHRALEITDELAYALGVEDDQVGEQAVREKAADAVAPRAPTCCSKSGSRC
jgi:hypothetical protein